MHHNSIAVTPRCNAARCAGVALAVEPNLRDLQMQPGVRRHENARDDTRGDALLAMPEGMLVFDVSIVHALAVTYLQGTVAAGKTAEVDGASAAMGEHNKEDEYRRDMDGGAYEWEPVVVDSTPCQEGVARVPCVSSTGWPRLLLSRTESRSMCLCSACERR